MRKNSTPAGELIESIRQRRLAVIVGSGVSRYSDPKDVRLSWRGLIAHGLEFCSLNLDRKQLEQHRATIDRFQASGGALTTRELIESAQAVEAMLGAPTRGDFRHWLGNAFSDTAPVTGELLKELKSVPARRMTLNYDTFLEQAFRARSIPWTDAAAVLDWLRVASPDVLHIHGVWNVPESVVFGESSYARVRRNSTIQQALKTILLSNAVLFVGCGQTFDDPNIGKFMSWAGRFLAKSQYHHFKLDVGPMNEVLEYDTNRSLYSLGYGSTYDELPRYLEYLLTAAKVVRPRRTDALSIKSYGSVRSFVGRSREIVRLRAALAGRTCVAIPVLGPPGVGKTRFVTQVLQSASVERRYITIVRAHCDGLRNIDDLLQRLARELGQLANPSRTALLDHLSKMPTLLLFDNAESFPQPVQVELCALIKDLLGRGNISVIITYRGKSLPAAALEWHEPIELGPLDAVESQTLFLQLAGEKFRKDRHLPELLGKSGGFPLVIRNLALAARKMRDIAELLAEYVSEPSPFIFDDPAGESGVGSAASSFRLALSNPALSDADIGLLSLVSQYPQGLSTTAVTATLGNPGTTSLRELRGAWLLEDILGTDKVTVLPPLRYYLKLERPAPDSLIQAFTAYFTTNCLNEAARVGRHGGAVAAARISAVLDETEVSIRQLSVRHDKKSIGAATTLANYMDFTGFGSVALLIEVADCFAGDPETAPLLERVGDVYLYRNALSQARGCFAKALDLFDKVGNRAGKAKCVKRLGDIEAALGDPTAAIRSLGAARRLYGEVQDENGQARCDRALAVVGCHRLELEAALHLVETARRMFGDDPLGEGNCNNTGGYIQLLQGAASDAEVSFRKAHRLLALLGDSFGMGTALLGIGECALTIGRLEEGLEECQRARSAFRAVGRQLEEAYSILVVGMALQSAQQRLNESDVRYAMDQAEHLEDAEATGLYLRLRSLVAKAHPEVDVLAAHREWEKIGRRDLIRRFGRNE
jgi:tetratricopeptide (TPR) repeat protein